MKNVDDRMMAALFVLANSNTSLVASFDTVVNSLRKASINDTLYISYNKSGLPDGFITWKELANEVSIIEITWIVVDNSLLINFMRSFRNRQLYIGKKGYRRRRKDGSVVINRWNSKLIRPIIISHDNASDVETILNKIHQEHSIPLLFNSISKKPGSSSVTTEEILLDFLPIKTESRYLNFCTSSGLLAKALAKKGVKAVFAFDYNAMVIDSIYGLANKIESLSFYHISDSESLERFGKFDGAIGVGISGQTEDIGTSFQRLFESLKPGSTSLLVDVITNEVKTNNYNITPKGLTKKQWLSSFSSANLSINKTINFNKNVINFLNYIIKKVEELPIDKELLLKVKAIIEKEIGYYLSKKKIIVAWELTKNKKLQNVHKFKSYRHVTLVMLSGGIDSIYRLWECLATTNDHIIAHHIHFINFEKRHIPEAQACDEVVAWLRNNVRSFKYSESAVDRRAFQFFGYDTLSVAFEAGLASQSFRLEHNRAVDRWTIGHCLEEAGNPKRWPLALNCCDASSFPFESPSYFETSIIPKQSQIDSMPKELAAMSWGCRRPILVDELYKPCGNCNTCKSRDKLGLM